MVSRELECQYEGDLVVRHKRARLRQAIVSAGRRSQEGEAVMAAPKSNRGIGETGGDLTYFGRHLVVGLFGTGSARSCENQSAGYGGDDEELRDRKKWCCCFWARVVWEAVDQVRCGSKEGKWPVRVEVFSHFRVRDAPASARVWGASGRLGMMKYLYRQHTPARYF